MEGQFDRDIANSYAELARSRAHFLAAFAAIPDGCAGSSCAWTACTATRLFERLIQSEWHYAMAVQYLRGTVPAEIRAVGLAPPCSRESLLVTLQEATADELSHIAAMNRGGPRPGARQRLNWAPGAAPR